MQDLIVQQALMRQHLITPAFSLLFLLSFSAFGQGSDCEQNLAKAEDEFGKGHYYEVVTQLACLGNNSLSRELTRRGYLLLCESHLLLGDPVAAENDYLQLLRADPEFVPNNREHSIDIVYLSKKFTATPIFVPHGRIGLNFSYTNLIRSQTVDQLFLPNVSSAGFGFQFGGGVDWNYNDNISLCLEANFATRAYSLVRSPIAGSDFLEVSTRYTWFDFPLYVKYASNTGNIRPYGYAGMAINYMLSASNDFVYHDVKPSGSQLIAEGPSEDVTYQFKNLNRSWMIGGGIKYKLGRDFLYADVRFMGGMTNMSDVQQTYYQSPGQVVQGVGNPQYVMSSNVTKYRYTPDAFRMDNISLSFGYIKPLYQPRKLKKANTNKVARILRKKEKGNEQSEIK